MSNTKAVHLKSFRKFVLQRSDEAAYQKILDRLSAEDRVVVTKQFLASQWVSYQIWWRLLVAADQVLGSGDYRIVREIGSFDAEENLHGIYQAFLKMMNVKSIISQSGLIWKRYYDAGTMKVIRLEKDQAEMQLSGFPGLPLHHEEELIGWMQTALKLSGAKNFTLGHDLCLAKGDPYCRFQAHWEA